MVAAAARIHFVCLGSFIFPASDMYNYVKLFLFRLLCGGVRARQKKSFLPSANRFTADPQ